MSEPIPSRIGKFEVEERMPPGGMSYVYRARHPNVALGLRAIKVLRPEMAVVEEYRARFLREAEIGGGFDHENVVHIYDFGGGEDAQSPPYMVMEFVEGSDLSVFTSGSRTCGVEEKLQIARQMASALAYIHQMGVFHRDVKPQNFIRRESDGRVKLIDFGIAKQHDVLSMQTAMTVPGTIVGTPHYMAPEQTPRLSGPADVNHLVDVYAFGVVLFELMAGGEWTYQLPQGKDTPTMVAFKWICERPLDTGILREVYPPIPETVCSLIQRCTEKDPAARIQSFSEIVDELDRIQTALNSPEAPAAVRSSASRSRFGGWTAAVGGLAALVVVLGIVWMVVGGTGEVEPVAFGDTASLPDDSGTPAPGREEVAPPVPGAGEVSGVIEPESEAVDGETTSGLASPIVPDEPAAATPPPSLPPGRVPPPVESPGTGGTTTDTAAEPPALLPSAPPDLASGEAEPPGAGNPEPVTGGGAPATGEPADNDDVPIRVSASEMAQRAVSTPEPVYPAEALQAGLADTIVLEAGIDRQGRVTRVSVIRGNAVLAEAAMDAVREWRYRPWDVDGEPVDVVGTVSVPFRLPAPAPDTVPVTGAPTSVIPPCSSGPRPVTLAAGQLVSFTAGSETFALYLIRVAPSLAAEGGLAASLYWLRTDQPWWSGDRVAASEIRSELSEQSDTLRPESYVEFTLSDNGRLQVPLGSTESLDVAMASAATTASTFAVCRS